MNVLFLRTKEEAVPEIMSLFGALGDAEAVLETVTGEGSGIDMIEGADILSRTGAQIQRLSSVIISVTSGLVRRQRFTLLLPLRIWIF